MAYQNTVYLELLQRTIVAHEHWLVNLSAAPGKTLQANLNTSHGRADRSASGGSRNQWVREWARGCWGTLFEGRKEPRS